MRWILCFLFLSTCTYGLSEEVYEGNPTYQHFGSHRLDLMAAFVRENPTVLEAGGHYGEDTQKLAARWPK